MEPLVFYERRCMHCGENDVYYGKSIKIKFNNTTVNSGHSWKRKTTQDKDLIHAYGLNKENQEIDGIQETKPTQGLSKNVPHDKQIDKLGSKKNSKN